MLCFHYTLLVSCVEISGAINANTLGAKIRLAQLNEHNSESDKYVSLFEKKNIF